MSIQFVAQAQNSGSGATPLACTTSLDVLLGDLIEVQIAVTNGTPIGDISVDDNAGNSYEATSLDLTETGQPNFYVFVAYNCAANAATTPSVSSTSGNAILGVYARQIRGAGTTSAALIGINGQVLNGFPSNAANAGVSGTVAVGSTPINVLVCGFCAMVQNGGAVGIAGTSPLSFTASSAVWANYLGVGSASALPESVRVVGATGNVQATFSANGSSWQFDACYPVITVYAEATVGLAAAASDTTSATGAISVAAALAAGATDATAATGKLSLLLNTAAADTSSATGAITAAAALAAAAADATSAAASLLAIQFIATTAADTSSASGALTAYAVVTLEAPLYTGFGGIFDPGGTPWSNGAPVAGSVIYYDPTYVTVETNGEIFSTVQNCTFLAMWNNGGIWSQRVFAITGQIVGPAFDATSASGLLTIAGALVAAATNATTATGLLTTRTALSVGALDSTVAAALLTVNGALIAAAADVTTATGALTTKAALLAAALDTDSATGALNAPALAGAATDVTTAVGALTAMVPLVGAASDLTTALGALTAQVALLASAIDSTGASGALLSGPQLNANATDSTVASATLSVRALLTGAAIDLTSASSTMTIQWGLLGAAVDTSVAAANLLEANIGLYALDPEFVDSAPGIFGVFQFPPLGATEARVLTFDFSSLLFNGELLASVPNVEVVTTAGTDLTPTDILNGVPSLDATLTKVMQPINCANGVVGNNYYFVVSANTTNPQKVVARYGLITIHS